MAELDAAQSRVRQLILDIDAVDATIRLFQPDIDLDVVKVRPDAPAARGEPWGYVQAHSVAAAGGC